MFERPTLKGTSSRAEDLKVRFWNLWGGSSACRAVVTASARGSVYRDPTRMEAIVLSLDRYMPFIDAPMLLHREPALFELAAEAVVRRAVAVRAVLRGGDVGRVLGLAPSLLLADEDDVRAAVEAIAEECETSGGGGGGRKGRRKFREKDVFDAAFRAIQGGGAVAFLARGRARRRGGGVVLMTEKGGSVHVR